MDTVQSRRDLMTRTLPAAALATAAFGAVSALGQQGANPAGGGDTAALKLITGAYDGQKYTLPKLPYDYNALEPHIDAQTMELHHSKHHQGYVNNLNKALDRMKELAGQGDAEASAIEALQRDISFNGGGHILHTMFWGTMSPDGGGEPQGELAEAIDKGFGSFDQFKGYFAKVAGSIKGSGWGILAVEPIGGRLFTFGLGDQDMRLTAGTVPILLIDVWEHAYYLKYQNNRSAYIDAWWNVVNWNAVNQSFTQHQIAHHAGGAGGAGGEMGN